MMARALVKRAAMARKEARFISLTVELAASVMR
jgi:hypothetical protein